MTSSQQMSFMSEIKNAERLPTGVLAYFQERLKYNLYEEVLKLFLQLEKENQFTRAKLARRTRKSPEQITRYLGAPSNWTFDTLSDLLLAMGYEPKVTTVPLLPKASFRKETNTVVPILLTQETSDGNKKGIYYEEEKTSDNFFYTARA